MIYVCPEHDAIVQNPCDPCSCGMDKLPAFAPNPLARLVGELPNLRERLAKAQLGWKGTAPANQTITVMSKSRGADFDLLAASPSAHAIAIEAIERLEAQDKAIASVIKHVRVLQSHAEGAKRGEKHNVDGAYLALKQALNEYDAVLAASKGETG